MPVLHSNGQCDSIALHEERLRQRVEGMQRNLAVAKIGSMWKTQSELKKDDPFEYKRQFDAASQIQALYRGSKIQHWKILKDLPFRRAVMHKRMMESTVARGRADNRLYLRGMQGDSASESDEDWEEYNSCGPGDVSLVDSRPKDCIDVESNR